MYICQASPLTKIFLPEWHERCLSNPEVIFQNDPKNPWKVAIPRPSGAIELLHNVPVIASSLIVKTKERKITEDEVSPLVDWLTNEQNSETDIYGVVAVAIETNVADAIMALVYEKNSEKASESLIDEIKKQIAGNLVSARDRADKRVLRQCEKMYDIVRSTISDMKKDGKGSYAPSYSEALALEILKDQVKLRRKPDERAAGIFNRAMEDMVTNPL